MNIIKILFLFFVVSLLNGCATTMSTSQLLSAQQREEDIINNELKGRKLDFIEGIWRSSTKGGGWTGAEEIRQVAIYKRGDLFIVVPLGYEEKEGSHPFKKTAENTFQGNCTIKYGSEDIRGTGTLYSTDDNTLFMDCKRTAFISESDKTINQIGRAFGCFACWDMPKDYTIKSNFKRLWPEDLKKHNSKL